MYEVALRRSFALVDIPPAVETLKRPAVGQTRYAANPQEQVDYVQLFWLFPY